MHLLVHCIMFIETGPLFLRVNVENHGMLLAVFNFLDSRMNPSPAMLVAQMDLPRIHPIE